MFPMLGARRGCSRRAWFGKQTIGKFNSLIFCGIFNAAKKIDQPDSILAPNLLERS
jgi:hypothetical protein